MVSLEHSNRMSAALYWRFSTAGADKAPGMASAAATAFKCMLLILQLSIMIVPNTCLSLKIEERKSTLRRLLWNKFVEALEFISIPVTQSTESLSTPDSTAERMLICNISL